MIWTRPLLSGMLIEDVGLASDAERESALLILAEEMFPQLSRQEVKGDGNCLHRAVGTHTVGEDEFDMVRKSIIAEVETYPERYDKFVTDLPEWIQHQRKDKVWGDGISVLAATNSYMAPIVVWRSDSPGQRPSVFLPSNESADMSPLITLELDEKATGAEHYSPLVRTPQKGNAGASIGNVASK